MLNFLSKFAVITFIISGAYFYYRLAKSGNVHNKSFKEYYDREKMASETIKKDLPELNYIKANANAFNVMSPSEASTPEQTRAYSKQKQILEIIDLPKIILKEETTTEIKVKYGANNLDKLTQYEQNYYTFIHQLHNFAEMLVKADKKEAAIKVLEESIILKSEFSKSYTLLASLYKEFNHFDALNGLHDYVQNVLKNESLLKVLMRNA